MSVQPSAFAFGGTLGALWGHFGSFWGRFGSSWGHFGVTLGSDPVLDGSIWKSNAFCSGFCISKRSTNQRDPAHLTAAQLHFLSICQSIWLLLLYRQSAGRPNKITVALSFVIACALACARAFALAEPKRSKNEAKTNPNGGKNHLKLNLHSNLHLHLHWNLQLQVRIRSWTAPCAKTTRFGEKFFMSKHSGNQRKSSQTGANKPRSAGITAAQHHFWSIC